MSIFADLPKNHFAAVHADCPWRFRTWSETNQKKSASRYYSLMTLEEIMALPVKELAAKDCVLFLWAINPMLPHALRVMDAWGFRFKTLGFSWAKLTPSSDGSWIPKWHVGTGYYSRANVELCLLGTRGKPKRLARNVRQLIVAPRREHSRKPDEVYASIERLVPGPRLDLFGRQSRQGWTVWGAESNKYDQPAATAA